MLIDVGRSRRCIATVERALDQLRQRDRDTIAHGRSVQFGSDSTRTPNTVSFIPTNPHCHVDTELRLVLLPSFALLSAPGAMLGSVESRC